MHIRLKNAGLECLALTPRICLYKPSALDTCTSVRAVFWFGQMVKNERYRYRSAVEPNRVVHILTSLRKAMFISLPRLFSSARALVARTDLPLLETF